MNPDICIGLMSGTSLDGVDAALVDFSSPQPVVLATHFAPFDPGLRTELLGLQSAGANEIERSCLAANGLARAYATGVEEVLRGSGVSAREVRAIGAHGQTVRHKPESGFTVQLNNPALLAELTRIAVVADFRSRDIAAGGQGAPLAPAFHQAFFASPGAARAVVNIGGIANVTLLAADGGVGGFDTGPGNVLLDAWSVRHTGAPYDACGAWARSGKCDEDLLESMLAEPYFRRPAPKSTGRDLFNAQWLDDRLADSSDAARISPADVQATLVETTARSIVDALAGEAVESIFVCGGGARNDYLMERIQVRIGQVPVRTTASLGIPPDWVEAVAFAWLALQASKGNPANLPAVTGASGRRLLGAFYPA